MKKLVIFLQKYLGDTAALYVASEMKKRNITKDNWYTHRVELANAICDDLLSPLVSQTKMRHVRSKVFSLLDASQKAANVAQQDAGKWLG